LLRARRSQDRTVPAGVKPSWAATAPDPASSAAANSAVPITGSA